MAYGATAFFLGILHTVFLLYHIDFFLLFHRISRDAFWWGEAVFLVWNAVNDLVLGWLADRTQLRGLRGPENTRHLDGVYTMVLQRLRSVPAVVLTLVFWA